MPRKDTDTLWILILMALLSCLLSFMFVSVILRSKFQEPVPLDMEDAADGGCCRGVDGLELWGSVVMWGSDFKLSSPLECCEACKATCAGNDDFCLCDSWVFCSDPKGCGPKFGECWLKKQNDLLDPDWQEDGDYSIWMSGFNFGNVEAIVKMETKYGTLHIKLLAECSPHSFIYILELLASRHCVGCRFVRAEGHGESWDSNGNHMTLASFGPPFAILQGTLEAEGVAFKKIPLEACSSIRRGSVGWIGSGPEFFISLANHQEWTNTYTVFGYVLPDDMETVEKIATLPTVPDVWNNINVSVLETPVSFWFQRLNKATEET